MDSSAPVAPEIPGAVPKGFLGAGGFADVFLYEQQVPRREVAVKVLRSGAGEKTRAHFESETNLMARLSSHPSILSVYGAGVVGEGRGYLMMEYCPPPDLGKRCVSQPLNIPRALEIAVQIAGAVETLHEAGYLHRDIKPANILVTTFNRPVLTDFGIAAPIDSVESDDEFGGASPPWAPPEQQLDEGSLSPATDVYALAATIYTLLAGRSPHVDPTGNGRNDQLSILDRVLHRPVPPIGRQDVPAQVERVLATAMAKKPEDRYSTAEAFARAIQQVQTDLQIPPTRLDIIQEVVLQTGSWMPDGSPGAAGNDSEASAAPGPDTSAGIENDSTRFVPRRVDAQNRPMVADASPPMEKLAAQNLNEELDDTVTPERLRQRQDELATVREADAWDRVQETDTTAEPATTHVRGPQEPRRHRRNTAVRALAGVVTLAVVGIAGWGILHGFDPTVIPDDEPSTSSVVDPPPALTSVPSVRDLEATLNSSGQVEVTWGYDEDEDIVFMYYVDDPEESSPVRETTLTHATVQAISGRTCVQVEARTNSGQASEPETVCIATP